MQKILMLLVVWMLFLYVAPVSANRLLPDDSVALSDIPVFLKSMEETGTGNSRVCYPGMFKTYKTGEHYYWQVPDSLLGRDILVTVTLLKGPARPVRSPGKYGYGGDLLPGARMIRLVRRGEEICLQEPYCYPVIKDTDLLYKAWELSQDTPELMRLKIQAGDKESVLIEVTSLLTGNHPLFSLSEYPGILDVGSFQPSVSGLTDIRGGADHLLFFFVKGHAGRQSSRQNEEGMKPFPTRWEMAVNLYLLPREPLTMRYWDPRVGYFAGRYKNYSENPYGPEPLSVVKRWRLEPKPEDVERYRRGELVEPAKPIVFYVERSTPDYLVPYFIKAVNAWQRPFECAGFKNAIVGKLAPTEEEEPDFSIADVRHSVISYKASAIQNAYGPMTLDPRSGEIICSHVGVFHGVIEMARQWYFSQCAAVDPGARREKLADTLVGELLQMVLTHEIGHSLGLTHNFGGSAVYSVAQLRDKEFVRANGTGNSIMDYIRFNYVAQPEDKMACGDLIPRIGPYDEFAIEWGYRCFPGWNVAEEQKYLAGWVEKKQQDSRYWFGNETDAYDPRKQQEDLSDDPVEASTCGLKNLKAIMECQEAWMIGKSDGWRQEALKKQFRDYVMHVTKNIGGVRTEETGGGYRLVPKERQRKAIKFLAEYVFEPPLWLWEIRGMDKQMVEGMREAEKVYGLLLDELGEKFQLLRRQEVDCTGYSVEEYIQDLHQAVFPASTVEISPYRKCLQRLYVDKLKEVAGHSGEDGVVAVCLFQELTNILAEMQRDMNRGKQDADYRRKMSIHIERWLAGAQ